MTTKHSELLSAAMVTALRAQTSVVGIFRRLSDTFSGRVLSNTYLKTVFFFKIFLKCIYMPTVAYFQMQMYCHLSALDMFDFAFLNSVEPMFLKKETD